MEFLNGIQNKFEQHLILNLFEQFKNSGLKHSQFTFDFYLGRTPFPKYNYRPEVFRFEYLQNKEYYFEFWWDAPGMPHAISCRYFPEEQQNDGGGNHINNLNNILSKISIWLSTIKYLQEKKDKFIRITTDNKYEPSIGIIIEDRPFNIDEYNTIKQKLDSMLETLNHSINLIYDSFVITNETLEDVQSQVNKIKLDLENTTLSKKDFVEMQYGKIVSTIYNEGVSHTSKYFIKKTIMELLNCFHFEIKQLPPIIQDYLSS